MVSSTVWRVPDHTADHVNERIRYQTDQRLAYFAHNPNEIACRLWELDREWNTERLLATNSSALTLIGLALATTVDRKWLWLSAIVQGFYMQHAVQGWCPPLPIMRRLGVRTPHEIAEERYALLAIQAQSGR